MPASTESQSTEESSSNSRFNESCDWFLQVLVNAVHTGFMPSISLTVQLGGILVSGFVIPGKQYFEEFSSEYSNAVAEAVPQAKELAATYKQYLSQYGVAVYPEKDDKEPDDTAPLPVYIHMKDAHVFTSGANPIPGNRGVFWRGRISEVSGFFLGHLSPGKPE